MPASKEICFGPYLIDYAESAPIPRFDATGVALEFTTDEARLSPIYRRDQGDESTGLQLGITDLRIHNKHVPCVVTSYPAWHDPVPDGYMIPLADVLLSIHRSYAAARHPEEFLCELRAKLPDEPGNVKENLLAADLAAAGFRTRMIFPYGRTISIDIEWAPPRDIGRKSTCSVGVGMVEFLPLPDRTLGKGKWMKPRHDLLGLVFKSKLTALRKGPPIGYLSESGIAALTQRFEWKPVTLLSRKELAEAKLAFIREHPEWRQDLGALAKGMIEAGLYTKTTARYAAKKSIEKIIAKMPGEAGAAR